MKFRHEWKHEITYSDMIAIRQRLLAVATPDSHAVDGRYRIRSLYFDDFNDQALRDKIDGISRREKFRIRYYNDNLDVIHLEKKSKIGGLGNKQSASLSREEAQSIVDGQIDFMKARKEGLIHELYLKMTNYGLHPKTIVDYIREPFIFQAGNVRVTLDYDIRTGLHCIDFLNPDCPTIPAGDSSIVMEVKWDEFLPSVIRDTVQLTGRRVSAFSKYAVCRLYG